MNTCHYLFLFLSFQNKSRPQLTLGQLKKNKNWCHLMLQHFSLESHDLHSTRDWCNRVKLPHGGRCKGYILATHQKSSALMLEGLSYTTWELDPLVYRLICPCNLIFCYNPAVACTFISFVVRTPSYDDHVNWVQRSRQWLRSWSYSFMMNWKNSTIKLF